MARGTPKNKYFNTKKDQSKKRRKRVIQRGFHLKTKEGQELEKNLENVVNREIMEHRRIPRAKLDQIFGSICKTKSTRGSIMVKGGSMTQSCKVSTIDKSRLTKMVEMYKKERAAAAQGMPPPRANKSKSKTDDDNNDDEVEEGEDDDDDDENNDSGLKMQPKHPSLPAPSQSTLSSESAPAAHKIVGPVVLKVTLPPSSGPPEKVTTISVTTAEPKSKG